MEGVFILKRLLIFLLACSGFGFGGSFSARLSNTQTLTANVPLSVTWTTIFDDTGCFSNSVFTANESGKLRIDPFISLTLGGAAYYQTYILTNGILARKFFMFVSAGGIEQVGGSTVLHMESGTVVRVQAFCTSASGTTDARNEFSFLSGEFEPMTNIVIVAYSMPPGEAELWAQATIYVTSFATMLLLLLAGKVMRSTKVFSGIR